MGPEAACLAGIVAGALLALAVLMLVAWATLDEEDIGEMLAPSQSAKRAARDIDRLEREAAKTLRALSAQYRRELERLARPDEW